MTKMLKRSANRAASSLALTGAPHVSLHPRSLLYRRKRKTCIPLVLMVIVLSPVYQYTLASDYQQHIHRHHHAEDRLHRVIRHNPEKKNEHNDMFAINSCNEPYPKKWESIMEILDNEQEKERFRKINSAMSVQAHMDNLFQHYSTARNSIAVNDGTTVATTDTDDEGDIASNIRVTTKWQPHRKLLSGPDANQQIGGFRMLDKPFNCPPEKSMKLHWHSFGDDNKKPSTAIQLSNVSLIAKDGTLVWNRDDGERHYYKKDEYCVWKGDNNWVTFKVCQPSCSDTNPCVRKCCPPWKIVDEETKGCKPSNPEWWPTFYRYAGDTETQDRYVSNSSVIFISGFPKCENKYLINDGPKNHFKLLLNGTLVQVENDARTYIHPGDFCIDGLYYSSSREPSENRVYQGSEWDQVVIACKPNTYQMQIEETRIHVYAALNFISAIFLLLTDTVYILIWRHQNNIHSWLQFSYATSLFFTFTCFAIVQIWSEDLLKISEYLCKIMGWITHFTYLSAFFWLTSMNFDLWWRFSRPLRSTRIQTQCKKVKRFLGFAAFSIVIPLMISCIGIILDYKYGDQLHPPITVPGFGKDRCYFESKHSQIPYLYFPAGILLLVDFIFFASTVLHLRKTHTHTELARTQSTSTMEDKKGVRVIAKLFVVMGVLWLFELLSWICGSIFTDPHHKMWLFYIFTPTDCLNSIQGVFIFFIFICKPNVRNQLSLLFRREDAAKTWNKQTPLASESTVQQPVIKQNNYVEIK